MKKKTIFGLVLLIAGLLVLIFPFISMIGSDIKQLQAQAHYANYQKEHQKELEKQREALQDVTISSQEVQDIFVQDKKDAEQQTSPYQDILDTNAIVGHISIPALGQNFDLYLDATYDKLDRGVATLVGTGAPLGRKGQRPIIAGHRITYNDMSFYFIPDLKAGDKIYITFLDKTLTYEVYDKEIIDEYNSEKLAPIPNQDVITLMTCTNAPEYNQRYLVNAKRTETPKSNASAAKATISTLLTDKTAKLSYKLIRLSPYIIVLISSAALVYFGKKLYCLIK